jgi:hypothetical protein
MRSVSELAAIASSSPGEGGVPLVHASRKQLLGAAVDLGGEREGRRVDDDATARTGDHELAGRERRHQPDHLEPHDRPVAVVEDRAVHVRRRELRTGAKRPAAYLERRFAEHEVELVAAMDAVEDDGRPVLQRADAACVVLGLALGIGTFVGERRLNVQRAAQPARGDDLAQACDRRMVPVREPDLQPFGGARDGAEVELLCECGGERLLGEDVEAGGERGAREPGCHPRRRREDDRVGAVEHRLELRVRGDARDEPRGRLAAPRFGLDERDELGARLA